MISLHRIALPTVNAILITIALLYAMFLLVDIQEPELILSSPPLKMTWTKIPEDTQVIVNETKPKPPVNVELPPIVPKAEVDINVDINEGVPLITYNPVKTTNIFNPETGQLVLAIGFPPVYPTSAAKRGVEGYVVVGFSVGSSGDVFDPFVIEAEPRGVFEKSALKAILKFKYKARTEGGKAVVTDGQRYMFKYEMDE